MTSLLIIKVTISVVMVYRNYIPPNFDSEFLRDRESYFFGGYCWAFYIHIATGPPALLMGLLLTNLQFLRRFPHWHRYIGRIHATSVIFLLAPSGFWMARYAAAGTISAVGFMILSTLTALTAILGWRAAVQRRFVQHRRWMERNYILLCSAVVLRVLGGSAVTFNVQWESFDTVAGWVSWLAPLLIYEFLHWLAYPTRGISQPRQTITSSRRPVGRAVPDDQTQTA